MEYCESEARKANEVGKAVMNGAYRERYGKCARSMDEIGVLWVEVGVDGWIRLDNAAKNV